jgi:hypothetical protein
MEENENKSFPEVEDIETDAGKKDTAKVPVDTLKESEREAQPPASRKMGEKTIETYSTPYFSIKYSPKNWEVAEGKSIDLPSYVDLPKKAAIGAVQLINKNNENFIFFYVSSSYGTDFSKMTDVEIVDYLRIIYNDNRIKNIPVKNVKNNRFAVLEFTPRNDSKVLVRQYLTTKDNYLYSISFIENKAEPINAKMVDEILSSWYRNLLLKS